MILLSGHSRTPAYKVPVEALSVELKERASTATMVPADMTGITTESWFLDDTNPGAGIVWRVISIETAYAINTPTIRMEHVINTLRDRILFGDIEAGDITGTGSDTCTAEQAVRYILSKQSDWRLGSFGFNVSKPYKFNGDTLYDAIVKVCRTLDGAWWSYDMSSYPFTLHITQRPGGVACEMRAGRNITAITKTIDKSGLYTRFYPIGKDDLHLPNEYASRNEGIYGTICKVETDLSLDSVEELTDWANERLRKHSDPDVNITAEGLDLADATGESLDRLTLGRICRVPLPEFGTTIEEYIIGLNYRDKVHKPEEVTVTLSNKQDDVMNESSLETILAEEIKTGAGKSGGGGGGRGAAKQQKEDHAWFEDTNDHVAMCAVGIIGTDAQGNPNWYRLSRLEVNENGIYGEVVGVQNDVEVAKSRIDQNEYRIQSEVTRAVGAESQLSSRIVQTATSITAEVNRATAAEGQLSSRITINAQGIESKVSKNGVISSINQSAESVVISASRINLSGYVTASELEATDARITNLMTGRSVAASLSATNVWAASGLYFQGNPLSMKSASINGTSIYYVAWA